MALGTSTAFTEFNESSWRSLQNRILVEKQLIEDRDAIRSSLDDEQIKMSMESEEISMKIYETTAKTQFLQEKITEIRQKIAEKTQEIGEIDEKIRKKAEDEQKLERKVMGLEVIVKENEAKKAKEKRIMSVLVRLVSHRKMAILEEVFEIFELKIDGGPASNLSAPPRTCNCQVVDLIRGFHLPQISHIFTSHLEHPTMAALAYASQLFNSICRVMNFAPKFPLNPTKATWKKRADREKFVETMMALGRNISELRESCGIPTMATDRALGTLEEWFRLVRQRKTVFERPVEKMGSPASLMIRLEIE
uniref:FRIGIDA-like protein n=1 Tax=Caenorhabditis tropicalis TaxID=1561998 RepID=A0A1I7UKJ7_9PELO